MKPIDPDTRMKLDVTVKEDGLTNGQDQKSTFEAPKRASGGDGDDDGDDDDVEEQSPSQSQKKERLPDEGGNSDSDLDQAWASAFQNPANWALSRKWMLVVGIALANLVASMAVTAFEPAIPPMMREFHSTDAVVSSLSVSIYLLGYIIGPLFIAPVSELYGRAIVIRVAFPVLLISLAGCGASQDVGMFVFFRAIGGFPQVALVLMGNALVADLIPVEKRGLGMSVILSGPSIGPTIGVLLLSLAEICADTSEGPITGGYVVEYLSWRWIFWIYLIATSILAIFTVALYQETFGPLLRQRWSTRRKSISPAALKTAVERRAILKAAWIRPFKLFVTSPVTMLLTFTSSVANGYLILALTTLGTAFQSAYGFSTAQSGLAYLGMAVGFVISQFTAGPISDRYIRLMKSRNNGVSTPEHRLPVLMAGGLILPAGFLLYGWTMQYEVHWILPIIGSAIISIGVMYNYMPSMMYLVDCFTIHAVSATGASGVIRSIVSVVLPLAANPMYETLGYGWGNSLLAFVALLNVPIALVLLRYGESLRLRYQVNL